MRSVFTNESQERPFDVVCEALLKRAQSDGSPNWWAIAHVYPDHDVLSHLSEEQKGQLLATWLDELHQLAGLMRDVWDANDFNVATMIVKRGDDSSTWNALAGAWNRARAHWIALLFALGMEDLLDRMCLGKALRLMAADVAAWHRSTAMHVGLEASRARPSPTNPKSTSFVCPYRAGSGRCCDLLCSQAWGCGSSPARGRAGSRYGAAFHLTLSDLQVWMTLPVALSTVRSLSENVPFAPARPTTALNLSST